MSSAADILIVSMASEHIVCLIISDQGFVEHCWNIRTYSTKLNARYMITGERVEMFQKSFKSKRNNRHIQAEAELSN